MKLLVDVNLSPLWIATLTDAGFTATHWCDVGDPRAADTVLLEWARENDHIAFTNDLDFSRLLALTHARGPSVFQVRTEDVLPSAVGELVARALRQHRESLQSGAIVVVDPTSLRARLLPI